MKKVIFFAAIAMLAFPLSAWSWGGLGHIAIQELALRHLAPEAAQVVANAGGLNPADSYWMDIVSEDPPYNDKFHGWHACIATPYCKSPLEVREEYRQCHDGVTALEKIREEMSDYRNLPDSIIHEAIKCIVHIVGDMHCPSHVRYTDASNTGKFVVFFNDEETSLHKVWDSSLIELMSGFDKEDASLYAAALDSWTDKQIAEVQKGWAQEWFEDVASDIRPTVGEVKKGDCLGKAWMKENIVLAEFELRKAGYRLAAALNEIFGK